MTFPVVTSFPNEVNMTHVSFCLDISKEYLEWFLDCMGEKKTPTKKPQD